MSENAFGRAIADYFHGEQSEPLIQRDGEQTVEHPVEANYFGEFDPESSLGQWQESYLGGPLLDVGAGAGRDTLYFQEQFETVATEVSDALVGIMRERGVDDARVADMFALRESFDRDRFRSVLSYGTQLGLAGSMDGLRQLLSDLAYVTDPDGTAVVDSYDPTHDAAPELLGYRPDPAPGLASRVMSFEYEKTVDDILLFRLFSPERLREATVGTPWDVVDVRPKPDSPHYNAALTKS
jgi:SAM-dependent methyltransferase